MSESYRGNGFKIVTALFILVIFALLVAGIYDLGREHGETIGKNVANTATYAKHTQEDIKECLTIPDDMRKAECIREVIESTNEQKRAEDDLVAQTEMSLWALWMLIITSLMAFVTAVGVYFVWRTLEETRKMAADQSRIGEAQVRAYLSISTIKLIPGKFVFLDFGLKNSGQSPAKGVEIFVKMEVIKIKYEINDKGEKVHSKSGGVKMTEKCKFIIPDIAAGTTANIKKGIVSVVQNDILEFDGAFYQFTIAMFWRDVFWDEIRENEFREDMTCGETIPTTKIKECIFGKTISFDMRLGHDVGSNRLTDEEISECALHN